MSTAEKEAAWTTGRTLAALRERYPLPQYALFTEVGDATGTQKCRSADAVAMGCWPSRGLCLTGFELKVSRSDWVKELADPAKAEAVCSFCDFWYVVAGARGIVRPGELPPTWGLLEPKGDKLVVSREAPALSPEPVSRPFLAALLRRAAETLAAAGATVTADDLARARAQAFEAGKKSGEALGRSAVARELRELETLRAAVERFEGESGLRLDRWPHGRSLGSAVRLVMSGHIEDARKGMDAAAAYAQGVLRAVEDYRKVADAAKEVPGG